MSLLDKLFGSEENVIQVYDTRSRRWEDEGIAEEVTGPDEYEFEGEERRRLIVRKKDKIKQIVWTTNGSDEKPKRKTRQPKRKSELDSIKGKADSIRKDREKLVDVRDAIEEILGGGSSDPEHEEWQYPSMATGLNRGIGHAFLMGMDEKKGDIAEAGLEMVKGFSNVMNILPVVGVAYAKSKGINVGLFGVDEGQIMGGGSKKPPVSPPPEPVDESVMSEHSGGFEIDTIDDDDDQEYEDYVYEECGVEEEHEQFDQSKYGEPEIELIDDDENGNHQVRMVSKKLDMDEDGDFEADSERFDRYDENGNHQVRMVSKKLDMDEDDESPKRTRTSYNDVDNPNPEDDIPSSISDDEAADLFEDDELEEE